MTIRRQFLKIYYSNQTNIHFLMLRKIIQNLLLMSGFLDGIILFLKRLLPKEYTGVKICGY